MLWLQVCGGASALTIWASHTVALVCCVPNGSLYSLTTETNTSLST